MFLSKYFLPLLKQASDASITSHQLMIRAGMIRQVASGIYSWLPLGLKVLEKVREVIRDEMNRSGALEINTPCMQPVSLWEKSNRSSAGGLLEETLKAIDRHENTLLFSPTAEEVFTDIIADNLQSYRRLPLNLYQISTKFRDEIRPRFGVLRGREFVMKDSYTFDIDEENALISYEKMLKIYNRIFSRLGIEAIPVLADSGAIGGDYSHEFHVLSQVGESTIFYDDKVFELLQNDNLTLAKLGEFYAREEAKHDASQAPLTIQSSKSIEVGHIFHIGTKYTKALNAKVNDDKGSFYPSMGCYGIGISRVVATLIEKYHDDKGIIWPLNVAPFAVIIVNLQQNNEACSAMAIDCYEQLLSRGIEVLYDDSDDSSGVKFARADLIGIPLQIIVGPRNAEQKQVELSFRDKGSEAITDSVESIINRIQGLLGDKR